MEFIRDHSTNKSVYKFFERKASESIFFTEASVAMVSVNTFILVVMVQ